MKRTDEREKDENKACDVYKRKREKQSARVQVLSRRWNWSLFRIARLDVKGKSNLTDWKRKDGRKKERREESAWSSRCGTMSLLGATCIVGGKEDSKEGRRGNGIPTGRKEGRKEGSGAIRDGKSNQLGKDPGVFRVEKRPEWDYVRLETIIVEPIRFPITLHGNARNLVDQSLSSRAVARFQHYRIGRTGIRTPAKPRNRRAFARRIDL